MSPILSENHEPVDPNEFIITRKRKKYKFALFANSRRCFEFDDWQKQPTDVVEAGAGTGLFSVELATRYPQKQFVAIDVKADRLQKGAYEAELRGLRNIRFLRARADQLSDLFPENCLETIWLTFPDPYPKKRSSGRRLTHDTYLRIYTKMLKTSGHLCLKHDSPEFFQWSLERMVACGWRIDELTFDLHDSDLDDDYKIVTTYESRWLNEGGTIGFVKAEPRS